MTSFKFFDEEPDDEYYEDTNKAHTIIQKFQ